MKTTVIAGFLFTSLLLTTGCNGTVSNPDGTDSFRNSMERKDKDKDQKNSEADIKDYPGDSI